MTTTPAQIEEVRAFWDRRPCNLRHSPAPVGSLQWSQEVTGRKYFVEPHIPGFADFERWRGKRVLEIGCGIGTDTLQFLKHGAHIDASDLSSESLRILKLRLQSHLECDDPAERIADEPNLHCCNAEEWLPAGPYDLIYSFGVLHHTPHPEVAIANIRDRLAPGGEVRLMLYARWSLKNLMGEQPEAQAGCTIARTYTAQTVRQLLEGLQVTSIKKTHIFPWRIEDYIQYRYVLRPAYRWMPRWLFSALERLLGWHLLIVARKA